MTQGNYPSRADVLREADKPQNTERIDACIRLAFYTEKGYFS